jgi:signal transduction histidine kinase
VASWPVRRKVALALLIPLILAATLGALRVRSDLIEAADASSSAKQITVLDPAVKYLTAAERAMVAAHVPSTNGAEALDTAVQDVRTAARALEETRGSADLTPEQNYQLDVLLDLSEPMRAEDANTLSSGAWAAQVRLLQTGVTQLITSIGNAQLEPEPQLEQLSQTLAGRFSLAMQQALVETVVEGGTGSLELFRELGAEGTAIDRLASALGDSEPAISAMRSANQERSNDVRIGLENAQSGEADVADIDLGGPEAYVNYDGLTSDLLNGIDTELDTAASDARQRALVNAAITLLALLAAIVLAVIVSRALINPIRRVREGALAVANEELPEAVDRIRTGGDPGPIRPIDVMTHEEIGQVARAVDDLHRQAVVLASREADLRSQVSDMFVTLSRRSNSLINQQLDLIETLEADEEDSSRLESLFRLDHLAARMRRTAESLMILADAPATRATATDELTVSAALQAATAAVQDYQRVRTVSDDASLITDTAAADVVHLLTELVDNALSFSAPSTTVSLDAISTDTGVVIEIADAGLGIPNESLAELNEILHSGGEVSPDTARRMGLLVVSRLAQRHGITVSLLSNQQRGITARVLIPDSVLERSGPEDVGRRSDEVRGLQQILPDQRQASGAPNGLGFDTRNERASGLPTRAPGGQPPDEPPDRPPARQPDQAPATPVPTAGQAATMDLPWTGDSETDTPIFKAMRSAWLSATGEAPWLLTEVEAGWDRAEEVATFQETPVNSTGLPVRRPGNRLVPGSVTKSATTAPPDPEAVRERLAAHAEGVSRGRRSSGSSDQSPTEAGPS